MLNIIPFVYNNDKDELISNTFLISDSNDDCIIVDPSKDNDNIKNFILKNSLRLKAILLTHGHFDHFRGAERLLEAFKVSLYIHELDEEMLISPSMNASRYIAKDYILDYPVTNYPKNNLLTLLNEEIKVIHTPYHTKGSVCFYLANNNTLLTGDSLFKGGYGRDDLENAEPRKRRDSIERIFSLPLETKVYPGHGAFTSLIQEKN